jgi:hypothetical protein
MLSQQFGQGLKGLLDLLDNAPEFTGPDAQRVRLKHLELVVKKLVLDLVRESGVRL